MAGKITIKGKQKFTEILRQTDVDLNCMDKEFTHVWVDGGGNCGPVSIGIVIVEEGIIRTTHGEYLGDNRTNNIAELTAIFRGLQLAKNKGKPVKLYSDSTYSLKSISGEFNGQRNRELINKIIEYVKEYPVEIIFVKVKGHSKLPFNEIADSIASWFLQHALTKKYLKKQKRKTRVKRTKRTSSSIRTWVDN